MRNINILFITNNLHKINEYKSILPQNFNLYSIGDYNLLLECEETGTTFAQNAKIKLNAVNLNNELDIDYVISEDSGLCIAALNNEPGIYSARYSNQGPSENNKLVIQKMQDKQDRDAYFTCVIGCKNLKNQQIKIFEGKVHGTINSKVESGKAGFAYDHIFIPRGYTKTFCNLGPDVKNHNSHRANAINKLVKYLNNQEDNDI